MKKLTLAAVLTALTTAVSAQNFTISGVIDAGFQHYNNGTTSFTRAANSGFNTSRINFQGSENLGGGLTAIFQLEGQINPHDGTVGSTTVVNNQFFNREAYVGLRGAFGEVRMGQTDVTKAQDVDFLVSAGVGNFALRGVNNTGIELGNDQNNTIAYYSPVMGGLQVQLGYKSNNANGATTDDSGNIQAVNVVYDVTKSLRVSAGHAKQKGATSVANRDFTVYGIRYNFGFMSAGISSAEGDNSTTGDVKSRATTATVAVPVAATVKLVGAYHDTKDANYAADNKGTGYSVGVVKDLSKRTSLYAAYASTSNDANAGLAIVNMTSTPSTRGLDTKSTMVGVSHVF